MNNILIGILVLCFIVMAVGMLGAMIEVGKLFKSMDGTDNEK